MPAAKPSKISGKSLPRPGDFLVKWRKSLRLLILQDYRMASTKLLRIPTSEWLISSIMKNCLNWKKCFDHWCVQADKVIAPEPTNILEVIVPVSQKKLDQVFRNLLVSFSASETPDRRHKSRRGRSTRGIGSRGSTAQDGPATQPRSSKLQSRQTR